MSIKRMITMWLIEVAMIVSLLLVVICGVNGYDTYVERIVILIIVLGITLMFWILFEIIKAMFETF